MRQFIPIVCFSLLGASAEPFKATSPVCDVAVETALCLHNAEKILMPDARPYGKSSSNLLKPRSIILIQFVL